ALRRHLSGSPALHARHQTFSKPSSTCRLFLPPCDRGAENSDRCIQSTHLSQRSGRSEMKTTAEVIKGKPCKVCGGVLRYKNSGKCIKCHEVRNKQRDRSKSGKAKTGKVLPPVIVERAVKVVPVEVTEPVNKDRRYYVTKIIAASHKAVE